MSGNNERYITMQITSLGEELIAISDRLMQYTKTFRDLSKSVEEYFIKYPKDSNPLLCLYFHSYFVVLSLSIVSQPSMMHFLYKCRMCMKWKMMQLTIVCAEDANDEDLFIFAITTYFIQ